MYIDLYGIFLLLLLLISRCFSQVCIVCDYSKIFLSFLKQFDVCYQSLKLTARPNSSLTNKRCFTVATVETDGQKAENCSIRRCRVAFSGFHSRKHE